MSDRHSSKSASASASSSPSPPPRKHKKRSKRSPPSRESSKSMSRSLSRSRRRYSRSRSFDRRDRGGGRTRYDYDDRHNGRRRSPSYSPPSRSRRYIGDRKSLQEHPPESRCLGVFGLNLRTDERQLRSVFEKYGPIDDIQLVYDYHSGMSRGFGFIYYKYVEDAIEARDSASGMDVDGRKIRVDFSITQRAHTPTPGTYLGRGGPRGGGGGSRYSRRSPGYRGQRSYSRSRSISPRGAY